MTAADPFLIRLPRGPSLRRVALVIALAAALGGPASAAGFGVAYCEDDALPSVETVTSEPSLICSYVIEDAQPILFLILWDTDATARVVLRVSSDGQTALALTCDKRVAGGPRCEFQAGEQPLGSAGGGGGTGVGLCASVAAGSIVEVAMGTTGVHEGVFLRHGRAVVRASAYPIGCEPSASDG